MVPLMVGQAKKTLFEDAIDAVPEGDRDGKILVFITPAANTIFTPAVSPATGMVVGEIAPGIAIGRIVLTDGAPLSFGDKSAPLPPGA